VQAPQDFLGVQVVAQDLHFYGEAPIGDKLLTGC